MATSSNSRPPARPISFVSRLARYSLHVHLRLSFVNQLPIHWRPSVRPGAAVRPADTGARPQPKPPGPRRSGSTGAIARSLTRAYGHPAPKGPTSTRGDTPRNTGTRKGAPRERIAHRSIERSTVETRFLLRTTRAFQAPLRRPASPARLAAAALSHGRIAACVSLVRVARPRVRAPRPDDIRRAAALVRTARMPENSTAPAVVYKQSGEAMIPRRLPRQRSEDPLRKIEPRLPAPLPAQQDAAGRTEIVERVINEKVSEKIERVVREQVDRAIHTNRLLTERLSRQVQSDLYQGVVIERERLGIG